VSWKAVDMQVALPRTQDARQLQEQRSKQHQRFQESLAHTQLKQEVINRKPVNSMNVRKANKTIAKIATERGNLSISIVKKNRRNKKIVNIRILEQK